MESAKKRRSCEIEEERSGKRQKKNHSGNFDRMEWDKEGLKNEVESKKDGEKINWSEMARRYNVRNKRGEIAKNGGQIIQEWLVNQGINIHRFKPEGFQTKVRARRTKKKGQGGEISIPVPETNNELKEKLRLKIATGEYTVGELIVPRKYEKLILDKDGQIRKTEFIVQGRKQPLEEIRKKTLNMHQKYTRVNPDVFYDEMPREQVVSRLKILNEYDNNDGLTKMRKKLKKMERTRHIQIWHDHSTLANHGHILFMVSCLYDPAIHLTNEEYKLMTGEVIDVQSQVEHPEIYIVGRCSSSDAEQLAYIDTRQCCLRHLQRDLTTEQQGCTVPIKDVMRFFHGDSPAQQFESGQQKGGFYYCSGCGVHASRVYELDHTFRHKSVSLKDRQESILKGSVGRKNSMNKKPKPLGKLKKEELILELSSRGIFEGDKKKELEDALNKEMHGVQRVPALLFENPTEDLKTSNLEHYEILVCEPMHDVSKHVENVLTELPSHVENPDHKQLIQETIRLTIGGKETKRAFDYRCAIINLSNQLQGTVDKSIQELIDTLVDIQDILYKGDNQRCPRLVLRLHNSTWYHHILCREVMGFKLKEMTTRKLYGTYFHDLTSHAPLQLRLLSGKTANAEEEERMFNTVKSITSATSNGRPDHIIGNLFVRLQAEEHLGKSQNTQSTVAHQQSLVSKLATSLRPRSNTNIPISVITKHARSWQAHLERISDFLLPGKGIWWEQKEESIEFYDSQCEPDERLEGPILHHFRSSSHTMEEAYLKECWDVCLENKLTIPTHAIWFEDDHGRTKKQATGFLDRPNELLEVDQDEEMPEPPSNCTVLDQEDLQEREEEEIISFNLTADDNEECISDPINEDVNGNSDLNISAHSSDSSEADHLTGDPELQSTSSCQIHHVITGVNLGDETAEESLDNMETSSIRDSFQQNSTTSHPSEKNVETVRATESSYHTTLGKSVAVVLGSSHASEAALFDKLRYECKNNPKHPYYYEKYMNELAKIQTIVLKKHRELKEALKEWDKKYFVENNRLPSYNDVNSDNEGKQLTKQLKYAKALLKEWKIGFTL